MRKPSWAGARISHREHGETKNNCNFPSRDCVRQKKQLSGRGRSQRESANLVGARALFPMRCAKDSRLAEGAIPAGFSSLCIENICHSKPSPLTLHAQRNERSRSIRASQCPGASKTSSISRLL